VRYFPEWVLGPQTTVLTSDQECHSYLGGGYAEEVGCGEALGAPGGAAVSTDASGTLHPGYPVQGKRFSRGGVYRNLIHSVGRCDARLEELICEAMSDDPRIEDAADGVTVRVSSLEVTLEGEVPDERIRQLLEDLVRRERGVRAVHNQLVVRLTLGHGSRTV